MPLKVAATVFRCISSLYSSMTQAPHAFSTTTSICKWYLDRAITRKTLLRRVPPLWVFIMHLASIWSSVLHFYIHFIVLSPATTDNNPLSPGQGLAIDTLKPENGHRFGEDIFKLIFLNEISIFWFSESELFLVMAWRLLAMALPATYQKEQSLYINVIIYNA